MRFLMFAVAALVMVLFAREAPAGGCGRLQVVQAVQVPYAAAIAQPLIAQPVVASYAVQAVAQPVVQAVQVPYAAAVVAQPVVQRQKIVTRQRVVQPIVRRQKIVQQVRGY